MTKFVTLGIFYFRAYLMQWAISRPNNLTPPTCVRMQGPSFTAQSGDRVTTNVKSLYLIISCGWIWVNFFLHILHAVQFIVLGLFVIGSTLHSPVTCATFLLRLNIFNSLERPHHPSSSIHCIRFGHDWKKGKWFTNGNSSGKFFIYTAVKNKKIIQL